MLNPLYTCRGSDDPLLQFKTMTSVRPAPAPTAAAETLTARYNAVRFATEQLCTPLVTEDYVVSSMADVSPTKWHLAHTSWFFETFVLAPHLEE